MTQMLVGWEEPGSCVLLTTVPCRSWVLEKPRALQEPGPGEKATHTARGCQVSKSFPPTIPLWGPLRIFKLNIVPVDKKK